MAGIAAAAVLFFSTRTFARGPPKTMTKEYQEASDAYLKVCFPSYRQGQCLPQPLGRSAWPMTEELSARKVANVSAKGTKRRTHHWCFRRRLEGKLHGAEQACGQAVDLTSEHNRNGYHPVIISEWTVNTSLPDERDLGRMQGSEYLVWLDTIIFSLCK